MPGGPRLTPQQRVRQRQAEAAKQAQEKAAQKRQVEQTAKTVRDASKNGMGSSVDTLTGGGIKTHPRTGVADRQYDFNPSDPSQVKDVQRFLVSRGYTMPIDGKFGPRTKSAYEAFTVRPGSGDGPMGKEPLDKYRERMLRTWLDANGSPVAPDRKNAKPYIDPPGSGNGNDGGTPPPTPPTDGLPAGLQSILKSIAGLSGIDPNLASNQANAEFDPAIHEAGRQLGLATAQKGQDQTDIGNWFDALVGKNQAGNKADTAALQQVLGDSSGLMKNVLGSLTDGTAKEMVGRTALTNEAALKGAGLAEGNYNRNMDTALALTGRDRMNQQSKADTNGIDQARATLLDVIGKKGAALVGHGNDNRQQALQNQTNLFNLMASAAMLPGQVQQQGLNGILTKAKVYTALNPTPKATKYDLKKLIDQAGYGIGVSNMRLPQGSSLKNAASTIGVVLKGAGLKPGSSEWRTVGSQILGSFQTPDGKPITVPTNWFTGANF